MCERCEEKDLMIDDLIYQVIDLQQNIDELIWSIENDPEGD